MAHMAKRKSRAKKWRPAKIRPKEKQMLKSEYQKPKCRLTGEDGNAFAVLGRVMQALKKAGQGHLIGEMTKKAISGDYNHLLATVQEYVDDAGDNEEAEN